MVLIQQFLASSLTRVIGSALDLKALGRNINYGPLITIYTIIVLKHSFSNFSDRPDPSCPSIGTAQSSNSSDNVMSEICVRNGVKSDYCFVGMCREYVIM